MTDLLNDPYDFSNTFSPLLACWRNYSITLPLVTPFWVILPVPSSTRPLWPRPRVHKDAQTLHSRVDSFGCGTGKCGRRRLPCSCSYLLLIHYLIMSSHHNEDFHVVLFLLAIEVFLAAPGNDGWPEDASIATGVKTFSSHCGEAGCKTPTYFFDLNTFIALFVLFPEHFGDALE